MSNLRPGIDDNFSDFGMIVRLNIPFDSRERMIAVLQAIALVQKEKMSPTRELGSVFGHDGSRKPRFVVADLRLNLLVGFGLRFFLGRPKNAVLVAKRPYRTSPQGGPSACDSPHASASPIDRCRSTCER
jgi:hypothetical protein